MAAVPDCVGDNVDVVVFRKVLSPDAAGIWQQCVMGRSVVPGARHDFLEYRVNIRISKAAATEEKRSVLEQPNQKLPISWFGIKCFPDLSMGENDTSLIVV